MTTTPIQLLDMHDESIDWADMSTLKEMTCVNHPTARYLTKNPWQRGLHFVTPATGFGFSECPCPFGDLRVVA
jgi:hypothetical protein